MIDLSPSLTDDSEKAYRQEVSDLAVWCQDNTLPQRQLELMVDYRKRRAEPRAHPHWRGCSVGWVGWDLQVPVSTTSLRNKHGPHTHTNTVVKKAQQLFFHPQEAENNWLSDPQKVLQLHQLRARRYRGQCVRPSTSLGPSSLPSRISIPGGVRGRPKKRSKTPATTVIACLSTTAWQVVPECQV